MVPNWFASGQLGFLIMIIGVLLKAGTCVPAPVYSEYSTHLTQVDKIQENTRLTGTSFHSFPTLQTMSNQEMHHWINPFLWKVIFLGPINYRRVNFWLHRFSTKHVRNIVTRTLSYKLLHSTCVWYFTWLKPPVFKVAVNNKKTSRSRQPWWFLGHCFKGVKRQVIN